jgi:hypothetical protein
MALDGVELDQANSAIVIRSIETGDGKENFGAVSTASGFGQRVTNHHRDTMDIIVRFAILIRKNDLAGRAAALEAANAWAARAKDGAWLTVNYKTNRRAWVKLVQAPGEGSLWDYTKDFQITFRAYSVPYWQEAEAGSTLEIEASTSGSGSLTVLGSADTVADVTLTNEGSATVDNCEIIVDGNGMAFENLGLLVGESLVIDHADDGLLRIRILDTEEDYRDALGARTPASADDLFCRTGVREASFTADYACSMILECKGRFL